MPQAKIRAFFNPESAADPQPPSVSDQYETTKTPPIRVTYQRRAPKSPSTTTTSDGIDEAVETKEDSTTMWKSGSLISAKNINKKRSYAQFHLEFGQSDFLLRTCSTCGLRYAPGDEGDEKEHSKFHKNYTHGIHFKGWKGERVVHVASDTGRVVLVLYSDSIAKRNKVQEVVKMMEIELGSGWLFQKLCKAYLFISSNRVAGCAIAEPIESAHRIISNSTGNERSDDDPIERAKSVSSTLQFGKINFQREVMRRASSAKPQKVLDEELNGATFCEAEAVPAICGIRAIWVCPNNRRNHIATHLLEAVRKSFQADGVLEHSQLAFSQPSSAGKALASRYIGTKSFLVYKQ